MLSMMSRSRWVPTSRTSWPLSASGKLSAVAMMPDPSMLTIVMVLPPKSQNKAHSRFGQRVLILSSMVIAVNTSRTPTPIMLMSTAGCKNAQLGVPSALTELAVGQYLRLDALALANHVQRGGKILQRKSRGQQGFGVY